MHPDVARTGTVDLEDVLAFVRIVEAGSFARAAERMALAKSILSRRVSRLERRLGAKLLTRTSRGVQPTAIGEAYHARAANILADLEAAEEIVADAVAQVAGPIRLSAPLSFGTRYLAPVLTAFAALHPRVQLDAAFDDKVADLTGGGFDLAVRIGTLPDSALVARKLSPVRAAVFASPAWLEANGTPAHPADLEGKDFLIYTNPGRGGSETWRFPGGLTVRGRTRLRSDNGDFLRDAATAGLGLVILPTFIAAPAIASGALQILLREHPLEGSALHIVMPPGRAVTGRVRALVDHLAAHFGPDPDWDPCWRQPAPTSR